MNQEVRHLTNLVFNRINYYLPKLIRNGVIVIENFLEEYYKGIKFKNDKIILKLGEKHGAINEPVFNNDSIEGLIISLTIYLDKNELLNRHLNTKNSIKHTINHEFQHIIEFYHTKGNLTKSWDFHKLLKMHENKYKQYVKWMDIIYMFYLMEDHEIRSRVSETYEYLKDNFTNINDIEYLIKSHKNYTDCDMISKLDSNKILLKMDSNYKDFNEILDDFIKNVIVNQSDNIYEVFNKEFKMLKKRASLMKKKLLNLSKNFINNEQFLEEYIEKDINWHQWL